MLPVTFDPCSRRVLVTGGQGFIGAAVVAALKRAGAQVTAPARDAVDWRQSSEVIACVRACTPVAIVHCCGVVGGGAWLQANAGAVLADAEQMTHAIVAAARSCGVQRLLGVGSTGAYPANALRPLVEDSLHAGACSERLMAYGMSKRALHAALVDADDLECGFVLPCNIYGPGQRLAPDRANVVGAVAMRLIHARRRGDPSVKVWGANARREFLHVNDAAAGMVDALMRLHKPAPVNLGSGTAVSIASLTQRLAQAAGFEGTLEWMDRHVPADALFTCAARARDQLAWRPAVTLDAGLQETVDWCENQDT